MTPQWFVMGGGQTGRSERAQQTWLCSSLLLPDVQELLLPLEVQTGTNHHTERKFCLGEKAPPTMTTGVPAGFRCEETCLRRNGTNSGVFL